MAPTSGQVGILLTLNTALSGEGMSGQRVWIKIVFWIGALVIFEMAYAPARASCSQPPRIPEERSFSDAVRRRWQYCSRASSRAD